MTSRCEKIGEEVIRNEEELRYCRGLSKLTDLMTSDSLHTDSYTQSNAVTHGT